MTQALTPVGEKACADMAQRYGISVGAVKTMLAAVNAGRGSMAQFYIPELGGGGQWMRGGMTMVGDMFNHGLKNTVNNLCRELSTLLAESQVYPPAAAGSTHGFGGSWWPSDLGSPSSSGGQNGAQYAYFPSTRRLAVLANGNVSLYDTLDHSIGGVQQQQGGGPGSLEFTSQYGTFTAASLPLIDPGTSGGASDQNPAFGQNQSSQNPVSNQNQSFQNNGSNQNQSFQSQNQSSNFNPPQTQSSFQSNRNMQPLPPQEPLAPMQPLPPMEPLPPQTPPANTSSSGAVSSNVSDITSAIESLAALHAKGILTDDEFSTKKSELLQRL